MCGGGWGHEGCDRARTVCAVCELTEHGGQGEQGPWGVALGRAGTERNTQDLPFCQHQIPSGTPEPWPRRWGLGPAHHSPAGGAVAPWWSPASCGAWLSLGSLQGQSAGRAESKGWGGLPNSGGSPHFTRLWCPHQCKGSDTHLPTSWAPGQRAVCPLKTPRGPLLPPPGWPADWGDRCSRSQCRGHVVRAVSGPSMCGGRGSVTQQVLRQHTWTGGAPRGQGCQGGGPRLLQDFPLGGGSGQGHRGLGRSRGLSPLARLAEIHICWV